MEIMARSDLTDSVRRVEHAIRDQPMPVPANPSRQEEVACGGLLTAGGLKLSL